MRADHAVVEILKREGVTTLFCFPTTSVIETAVAGGLRPIICRQERVGVDMADGYARVTNGRPPGVFAMQYGPGAENAFPGIATTFSDSVPVLFLPLGHAREQAQVFPMFHASRTYASVTKQAEHIIVPEQVPAAMRRAFSQLKNGRPGPVMVELPRDLLELDIGSETLDHRPVRPTRATPAAHDVEEAARLLVDAACPVILAGQGVLYAEASDELVQACGAAAKPGDDHGGWQERIPRGSRAGAGFRRQRLHRSWRAFPVCACGSDPGDRHRAEPSSADHAAAACRRAHHPRHQRSRAICTRAIATEVALLGDAKLALAALVDAVKDRLGGRLLNRSPAEEIATKREAWLAKWQAKLTSSETPITPYRVINEFMRVVDPADAIVTHDSGSPREQLLPFYRATRPRGYLGWGKSHQLGTGLGLTIGAKVAAPDKFCVNFMGDAAFGMTGLDFETAVRCGVPICTIVLNNSAMAIEIPHMKLSHERYRSRDLGGSYANLARDLGGWSERVEDPSQVADAILRARRQTEEGRACLLEFVTSQETAFSRREA